MRFILQNKSLIQSISVNFFVHLIYEISHSDTTLIPSKLQLNGQKTYGSIWLLTCEGILVYERLG